MTKYINSQIEIERVRHVFQHLSKDTIVANIGGGKFDHHQIDSAIKKDTCRLFFKIFGKKYLKNKQHTYILIKI